MATQWVEVLLRFAGQSGQPGPTPDQLRGLGLWPADRFRCVPADNPWQATLIYLVEASLEDRGATAVRVMNFTHLVADHFTVAAGWLSSVGPRPFHELRSRGLKVDVFVGAWIDRDQLDLKVPAAFLAACGNAGLDLDVITND